MFYCGIFAGSLVPLLVLSVVSVNRCQVHGLQIPPICNPSSCNCTFINGKWININCAFAPQQEIIINATFMPPEAYEFEISQAGNVVLQARSFSKLSFLQKVTVRNADNLIIKRDAFSNLVVPQFFLEIKDCNRVEIETKAFFITRGPVNLLITRCAVLEYNSEAVPWISEAVIRDIKHAVFDENSFSLSSEKAPFSHHGFSTKIILEKITTPSLPENVFSSSVALINISDCHINTINKNAFSALEVYSIEIRNTTINIIQSGAFSDRSLLPNLHFGDTTIERISTGAVLSAVTNFTFYNSNVETVEKEALNMSTMVNVYFYNNTFQTIDQRGITLKQWRKAIIENNTLCNLDIEAINVPYSDEFTKQQTQFHFVGNILENLKDNSLKLDINEAADTQVNENIFISDCRCELKLWVKSCIAGNSALIDALYDDSYCTLNSVLKTCFKQPEGFMRVSNFTESVCNDQTTIVCLQHDPPPVTDKNPNIIKAVGIVNENKIDQERKVISAVLAVACGGVLITLVLSLFMWFYRKGYKVSDFLESLLSRLTMSNDLARATSASSITRVSIHEYAEVWPQKLLNSDMEETYVCEDKATQTLPEELTQELLQSLREKLDDPENYGEARNMIEHLYDLIKVEESCNNNVLGEEFNDTNLTPDDDLMENVYDIIRPGKQRVRRYDRSFKTLAHKGTRAPSPDKLSPQSFTTSSFSNSLRLLSTATVRSSGPSITDYMEPTDQQCYTYVELPYDRPSPNHVRDNNPVTLADYEDPRDMQIPIYSELTNIAGRPLPAAPASNRINKDLGNSV